jgi:hypothetical protein
MVCYKCLRCGISFPRKSTMKNHFNKKNRCDPVFLDICVDECHKIIDLKDIYKEKDLLMDEIKKLRQINVLQEKDIENIKLKEIIKNQQEEIDILKLGHNHVKEEQSECIYLLLEREFIDKPLKVAKIGRSKCFKNRMRNYPKGSKLLCVNKCNDSVKAEQDLLVLFNMMFK